MSYQSKYTGAQIDEAVGKALAGGSQVYLHIYNAEFSNSDGKAYVNIHFLNSNPTAYGDFNSIPTNDLNTIVAINGYNHGNCTPLVFPQVYNKQLCTRYWAGTSSSVSFSASKYGTMNYDIWNSDLVYDMSGNLVDSNYSGH